MMNMTADLIGGWVLLLSLVSFFTMGLDKKAASLGARRVRESTLLVLTVLGGWPGTIAGMQMYRHKRRKDAFKYRCLLAIVVNIWLLFILVFINAR